MSHNKKPALVIFRADASLRIGTGHVMRCLTLAEALKSAGAECLFICREHPGNLIDHIKNSGFDVLPLSYRPNATRPSPEHLQWLGEDWNTDAAQTIEALGGVIPDWLIVDHYALEAQWEQALRPKCDRLMVIDDLADRTHDADLVLDQNLGREAAEYSGLVSENCCLLIGPAYALLRPEFADMREYSLQRRAKPALKTLLITMGGVDQDNVTGNVLAALKASELPPDLQINVVMGPHAPWLGEVQRRATEMPWQTTVLVGINNMAQVMADSDLAIGAAGSTSWERCCLGLPSVVVVLAENQLPTAVALAAIGGAEVVKEPKNIDDGLPVVLRNMTQNNLAGLRKLSEISRCITDGSGAQNVLRQLKLEG